MSLAQHIKLKTLAKNQKNGGPVVRARGAGGNGHRDFTNSPDKIHGLLAPHLPTAVRAWVDGLKATKVAWNQTNQCYEDTGFPDHRERRECARAIIEYFVGRPIERAMQVTGSYKELSVLVDELKKSPEAQRLIDGGFFDQLLRSDPEPAKAEGQEPSVETQPSE